MGYKILSNQQQSRYDDIQYYKAGCRTRSRSHTPEPIYKSRQDETKQLASAATPISSRSASPVTSKLTTNKRVVYQQKQTIVSPSLQNTRISSSPNDLISYESLPRAYITLELHL